MAGSALMLILGFMIAVAVIVFLSNAAPSKTAATTSSSTGAATSGETEADTEGDTGTGAGAATGGGGSTGSGANLGGSDPSSVTQNYAAASSSNKDKLRNSEPLAEGASLTSKNGKYVMTYEYGNIVVKSGSFTMWSSTGNLAPGGVVKVTDDGNFGIFPSQYSVTPSGWSSATAGRGTAPYSLIMKDTGDLILMDSSPLVIWRAPVTPPPVGQDCVMGDWREWSACSKTCGTGEQTRTRSIVTQPSAGGRECGPTTESRPCGTDPCPDCEFRWEPFGACVTTSPSTGVGTKQAPLTVTKPSGPGGTECPDPNSNIQSCVNCVMSPWSPEGELAAAPCSQATGIRSQTRTVTVPASNGGTCEPTTRQEACAVDCQLNPWPAWGSQPCENKQAGVGKQTRRTTVLYPAKNGGRACTVESGVLVAGQSCDASGNCKEERECRDCVQGTEFSTGNCDPATGRAVRTRIGDVQATNGGTACPSVTSDVACDIDCQVSGWAGPEVGWSTCNRSCGGGIQTRSQTVTREPKNNGRACPALTEERPCNTQACEPNVVGWSHQFGSVGDANDRPTSWYQAYGTTNGSRLRLRDVGNNAVAPLQLNINDVSWAYPDIWVKFGAPYTGTVAIEEATSSGGWREVARQTLASASTAFFWGTSAGQARDVNFAGKTRSTNGRCGPSFNNTSCPGEACCSIYGWCGGRQGDSSDWCGWAHEASGQFDGVPR